MATPTTTTGWILRVGSYAGIARRWYGSASVIHSVGKR
jgi:hypothetical protein